MITLARVIIAAINKTTITTTLSYIELYDHAGKEWDQLFGWDWSCNVEYALRLERQEKIDRD